MSDVPHGPFLNWALEWLATATVSAISSILALHRWLLWRLGKLERTVADHGKTLGSHETSIGILKSQHTDKIARLERIENKQDRILEKIINP